MLTLILLACAPEKIIVDSAETPCSPVTEVCDGIDNDCDGLIDDADPDVTAMPEWHEDADGDGYGVEAGQASCTQPPGYVADSSDCDDAVSAVNPDADETCDDADNDCDWLIDGQDDSLVDGATWYADRDSDGFGDPGEPTTACSAPASYVTNDADCDDGQPTINPDADELCDNFDNDCDALTDEEDDSLVDGTTWYADADLDGYGDPDAFEVACSPVPGSVTDGTDCDDSAADVNPSAQEVCDRVDDDCDGLADAEDDSLLDGTTFYEDADLDGYGDAGSPEIACSQPSGYAADDTDCDDADGAVNPGAGEVCNGLDDNCNVLVDAADPSLTDGAYYYQDADGDGYGFPTVWQRACSAPAGYVSDYTDCEDRSADVSPAGTEVCNGIDDDCDGLTDGQDASLGDGTTWYADADSDGYGDPDHVNVACSQPSAFVEADGDCDDGSSEVNPDATEVCDGYDNDCDALVDADDDSLSGGSTFYADLDGDGYGDATSPVVACSSPSGAVADAMDCDDTVASVRPCGDCAATALTPSAWELDAPADGDVTLDANLDGTTVDDTSLVVYGELSGYIAGSVTYASGRVTFHPDSPAQPGERVTAVLTQTAQCTDGGTPGPLAWTWTTAVGGGTGVLYEAGEVRYTTGLPYSITAHDFDGDGDLDLATADGDGDTVTILNGAPGAYFVVQQVVVLNYPSAVVGADLDRDGDTDLVVSEYFGSNLDILWNDGSGTFSDPVAVDASPHSGLMGLRAADMDGDGDLDLVSVSTTEDAVVTFANDGVGGFSLFNETVVVNTGEGPLDVGDLDGDGDLDGIASENGLGIFLNDGTGRLNPGADYGSINALSLYLNDLTGDGNADAAVPSTGSDGLYTFTGDGSGGFSSATRSLAASWGICGGDLDADGDLDLAIGQVYPGVTTLLNDGSGVFTDAQVLTTTGYYVSVVCADLNGDGALDVTATGAGGYLATFLNTP